MIPMTAKNRGMRSLRLAAALCVLLAAVKPVSALVLSPEDDARHRVVELALSLKGSPYVYGAASPQGFDCSGFVHYVYASAAFMKLPRSSRALYALGSTIPLSVAKPGDILVFGTASGGPDHVSIFLGNKRMVHAASEGPRRGIIISSVEDPYFSRRFLGARSYLAPNDPRRAETALAAAGKDGENAQDSQLTEIGCTVSLKASAISDPIPAVKGSSLAFVLTNGTQRDSSFEISLFLLGHDAEKSLCLRTDRLDIRAEDSAELSPYSLGSTGNYLLIVKDSLGPVLMQRRWRVIAAGRNG